MRWILYAEGARQATAVDLCDRHGEPVARVIAKGIIVDLPTRPRARMEPTKLRTTPRTAHLKKKGPDAKTHQGARPDQDGPAEA